MSDDRESFLKWFHLTHMQRVTYDETYEKEMEHDWRVWKAAKANVSGEPVGYVRMDLQDVSGKYHWSNISDTKTKLYSNPVYLTPPQSQALVAAAYEKGLQDGKSGK